MTLQFIQNLHVTITVENEILTVRFKGKVARNTKEIWVHAIKALFTWSISCDLLLPYMHHNVWNELDGNHDRTPRLCLHMVEWRLVLWDIFCSSCQIDVLTTSTFSQSSQTSQWKERIRRGGGGWSCQTSRFGGGGWGWGGWSITNAHQSLTNATTRQRGRSKEACFTRQDWTSPTAMETSPTLGPVWPSCESSRQKKNLN